MIKPALSCQTVNDAPRVVLVRLTGDVSVGDDGAVEAAFNEILRSEVPQHVVLDVRELNFLDCRFVGNLMLLKDELRKLGGKLAVFGLSRELALPLYLLYVLNLNLLLGVCADYPTALTAVTSAKPDAIAGGQES